MAAEVSGRLFFFKGETRGLAKFFFFLKDGMGRGRTKEERMGFKPWVVHILRIDYSREVPRRNRNNSKSTPVDFKSNSSAKY